MARKLTGTGKLASVKIKPECGELDHVGLNFEAKDFQTIASHIEAKEPLRVSVAASKIKIVTEGRIKECKIKADGAQLKYDGLNFTTEQYKDLAYLVKEEVLTDLLIESLQQTAFDE